MSRMCSGGCCALAAGAQVHLRRASGAEVVPRARRAGGAGGAGSRKAGAAGHACRVFLNVPRQPAPLPPFPWGCRHGLPHRPPVMRSGPARRRRIMTAFHEMGLQPEQLLAAVEGWADQRLRRLTPQSLSLALWSFARMGSGSPKLLQTAAGCAEQQLHAFTPAQLAKVAWALGKLRWPAPRVLRHAGAQLAERGAAFGDKEASNVLWALASEVRQRQTWGRAAGLGGCAPGPEPPRGRASQQRCGDAEETGLSASPKIGCSSRARLPACLPASAARAPWATPGQATSASLPSGWLAGRGALARAARRHCAGHAAAAARVWSPGKQGRHRAARLPGPDAAHT